MTSSGGTALLDDFGPVDGGQSYHDRQGCERRELAPACRSDDKSRFRHWGEVSVAYWRRRSLDPHSDGWYLVTSWSMAPLRPSADGRTHGSDQLRGQLLRP
jgi:hypothetical protein